MASQKIRPSKEFLNNKIYLKYKEHPLINKPNKLIEELTNEGKSEKHILFVLKALESNYIERKINEKTLQKYSHEIKKMTKNLLKKEELTNWQKIVKNADFYITYKSHMKFYERNKCLILFYICMCPRPSSDLLNLYYSENVEDLDEDKNYFIKDIKQVMFNKELYNLDEKLLKALLDYTSDMEHNQKLFDINHSRVGHIVEKILGYPINTLRKEYNKLFTL